MHAPVPLLGRMSQASVGTPGWRCAWRV